MNKALSLTLAFTCLAPSLASAAPSTLNLILASLQQRGFASVNADTNVGEILGGVDEIVRLMKRSGLEFPKSKLAIRSALLRSGCERLEGSAFPGLVSKVRVPYHYTPRCIAEALDSAASDQN